jgi:hypothetical protein
MREVSRRQAKLIKYYFGDGLPPSKAARLAGYRGRSTAALCNTAQRVLLKFLENPQRFIDAMKREALRELRERIERERGLKS